MIATSRHRRRTVLLGAAGGALLAASGCVSIGGGDTSAPTWYRLEDASNAADESPSAGGARPVANSAQRAARLDRTLLVAPVAAPGFYDSTMVAFSRARGTFAHYQFAGWAERPGRRIATLVERRLAARERFAAVAHSTAGVRGDLLLNLALEHLYHDVASAPGAARVAINAELVDWRERRLIARRAFEHAAPVSSETAGAAVLALGRALGALIGELCSWVETAATGGGKPG